MLTTLNAILLVLAGLLAVPVVILMVEVAASVVAVVRRRKAVERTSHPSVAVVVPAHNEQAVLPRTLGALLPQLRLDQDDRLIVVADNCSDQTAEITRQSGAECVVRIDNQRRGKGFALDAGMRHLEAGGPRPEVVIFTDADVLAAPGAIAALARQAIETDRPAQGEYLMDLPGTADASSGEIARPEDFVSRFAFVLKNRVRPLGLWQMGLPCPLFGSGMAFPWKLAANAPLATDDLVEDMRLGVEFCGEGHPPLFCPDARFTGELPADASDAARQRRRWEHGHLSVLTAMPSLLLRGLRRGDWRLCAAALDHAVQPLTILGGGLFVIGLLAFASYLGTGGALAAAALAVAGVTAIVLTTVLIVAWRVHLAREIPVAAIRGLPRYIVSRVPNQMGWFIRRQRTWVRTPRREERLVENATLDGSPSSSPAPTPVVDPMTDSNPDKSPKLVVAGDRD